jgi:prepilin-type N-terminal cleavage/methylation domain-containing protein
VTTSPVGNKAVLAGGGFSLVELLVVVAIMGMLAGTAAISLRGLRAPAMASAAAEVASALKATRQMAVASGRKTYFVVAATPNDFTTNVFRSYAIVEEIRPGEETREPPYLQNTNNNSFFIAKTDWRVLPEGIFFNDLIAAGYRSMNENPLQLPSGLGQPGPRPLDATGNTKPSFMSFTNFSLRDSRNPANTLGAFQAPFFAFLPDGRASWAGAFSFGQAGIRLVQGFVRNNQLAVTDLNNYYFVEVDGFVGRIRVRSKDEYRP